MNNYSSNSFFERYNDDNSDNNVPRKNSENLVEIYRTISKGLVAFFVVVLFSTTVLLRVATAVNNSVINKGWFNLYLTDVPLYCIAIWTFVFFMSKIKPKKPEIQKFGFGKGTIAFLIISFFMFSGAFAGNYLDSLLQRVFNKQMEDSLSTVANSMSIPIQIIFFAVVAPIGEELIFRKMILDRTASYGEGVAILFSALTFALYHVNINQFFYAFGAGLVLAYVYVKSGKYYLCVILHSAINALFGVIIPYISSYVFTEKKHIIAIFSAELFLAVAGAILLILLISSKKLRIKKSKYALEEKAFKRAFFNPCAIIFYVSTVFLSLMVYM